MNESIKNRLMTLAILQRTDSARDTIEKNLAGVEQRIDALGEQLKGFELRVAEGQTQLDALRKQYRADESEVKNIESSIAKSDDKLRSVKTNKEYQSMLKEIDDYKVKRSAIEDRMLEALESIEAAEKQVASLKLDLADMKREIQEKQGVIRAEAEEQRKQLLSLNQEHDEIWAEFEPKMKKIYERAKLQGHGIAVAAVRDGICQVCRMNLPPQAYIELLRLDAMSMCPICQRIMYPKAVIEGE